jgi:hypothetical protein
MDGGEIVHRTRQEMLKRTDALLFGLGIDRIGNEIRPWQENRSKFFFNPDEISDRAKLLQERMPDQVELIIGVAEKVCRHRFDLLGFRNLDYGREIDWHLDAVHGKRAPLDAWFKVPYLDFEVVGDSKVTWELNRHQHLVTLAKAYRLTDDQHFATELLDQWRDWRKRNPYPRGINWASSLEVALRSISWLWVYHLLEGTPAVRSGFRQEWLQGVALHGHHVQLYLSTYFSPNTHLLGEAMALFFIGVLCPELKSSADWMRQGWNILVRESKRQVRSDGFYFEQSTHYHVYAVDFLLHSMLLASRNGIPIAPQLQATIERMLSALALLCRAGIPPRWGDDDGGRVFDPRRNRAEHLLDPLSTGAAVFERGDLKFLAGDLREETIWLLGKKGAADFDRTPAEAPDMNSAALIESGLYVMSSDAGSLQVVIDAGPQGALAAGHGHADALSLTVHANGCELIGDPGTFEYVSASGMERNYFRGTGAHNTLVVDGRSQSKEAGPFSWRNLVTAKPEGWITGRHFDLFVGVHDGYSDLSSPVVHQRSVFFLKSRFWLVRDVALGTGRHKLEVRWHVNPEFTLMEDTKGHVSFRGKGSGFSVFPVSSDCWTKNVAEGLWSSAYGARETAPDIQFKALTSLPAEFVTILKPSRSPLGVGEVQDKLVEVECGESIRAYHFVEIREEHAFVFADNRDWTFQEWASDASFMYCARQEESPSLLILCNCRHLKFKGESIISSLIPVGRVEISRENGILQIYCSDDGLQISRAAANLAFQPDHLTRNSDGTGP